jgi:hypothetical protein
MPTAPGITTPSRRRKENLRREAWLHTTPVTDQEEASDPPVSSGVRHTCLGLRLRGGGFFQMPLRL